MGAWEIGPFDNDAAADLAGALDRASDGSREGRAGGGGVSLARGVLAAAADTAAYLERDEGAEAVAAAALIAAQCPGGAPVDSAYGPKRPLPVFTAELRPLAVRALDRVLAERSELAELWDEAGAGQQWRAGVRRLRAVLAAAG
ncbi:DUF4259 domain-containing protein [Kitasatospora sp. NPDC056138]|uniref:DUF4259 domain-containing protein n=1 Tax=Kitasatospora sp. NPDC056138 TaxID=3345724 RepID=UPI0035DC7BE6